MCGLVGTTGKLMKKDRQAFWALLRLDIIRGRHSTGVLAAKGKGDWASYKSKGNAFEFMQHNKSSFNGFFDDKGLAPAGYKILLGHNRAATVGQINSSNAHPFKSENEEIIGAHNGTIQEYVMTKMGNKYNQYATDSEGLINAIADTGLYEALSKVTSGAYALSLYDVNNDRVTLVRNKERPLWFMSSDRNTYWSSEPVFLQYVNEEFDLECEEPWSSEEHVVYDIDLEGIITQRKKEVVVEQPKYIPARGGAGGSNFHSGSAYENGWWMAGHQTGSKQTDTKPNPLVDKEPVQFWIDTNKSNDTMLIGFDLDEGDQVVINKAACMKTTWDALTAYADDGFFISYIRDRFADTTSPTKETILVDEYRIYQPFNWEDYIYANDLDNLVWYNNPDSINVWYSVVGGLPKQELELLEFDSSGLRVTDEMRKARDAVAPIEEEPKYVFNVGGDWINEEEAKERLKYGCCNCNEIVDHDQAADVQFIYSEVVYACKDCKDLPYIKQYIHAA